MPSAKLSSPKIALVGNSNAGKSTLFCELNAPGTTVRHRDRYVGRQGID